MKKETMPEVPDAWGKERHEEIEGYGLGVGFALFAHVGDNMRGILRTFFKTKFGPAVSVELTEEPHVPIYLTNDAGDRTPVTTKLGDLVNLSLSPIDLKRKLHDDLVDRDVGIQYTHDVATKSESMKVYRVVVFSTEVKRYGP